MIRTLHLQYFTELTNPGHGPFLTSFFTLLLANILIKFYNNIQNISRRQQPLYT